MKTLKPSLFVTAALAGILAAAVPAAAHDHDAHKKDEHKGKPAKKHKGKPAKKDVVADKGGDEKIHCLGINACKGKSECGVDGKHGCSGHNACKGQGWVTLAKKDCAAQKGTVHGAEKAGMPAKAADAPAKIGEAAEPAKK